MQVSNLSYKFPNKQVLRNINLNIPEHSIVAIVGSNGSGKTTLLNCMIGKYQRYEGSINKRSDNISFVSDIAKQYEFLTGEEYLSLINYILGHDYDFEALLQAFNLAKEKSTLIKNYSHGMKQKLALCSALIITPLDYLIMDEPFTGVDSDSMKIIKRKLMDLKNSGVTIIFTTHQIESFFDICDHMIYMNEMMLENGEKEC